jgi:hypothetical protein
LAVWFAVDSRQAIHRRVEATKKNRGAAIRLSHGSTAQCRRLTQGRRDLFW